MKSMHCRIILVICVLAVSTAEMNPVRADSPRFSIVAPGIAHAVLKVRPADAEPFSGHAFKIDLDVAELRLVPAGDPPTLRTVEQIVAPYPVVVATNASFFDKEGRAMGLAVDAGRMMALSNRRSWGALVIDGKQGRIMLGADIQDPLDHRLIVQGIPRLLVGGKVQQLKPQIAERTAVCAEGNIVVLVVSTKAEATAFARFLADPPDKGGLGCGDALNLDGGPSTQLVVKLPALALSLPGGWGVPNALVAVPGKT
jgi:exopolysaccharide biosynthesis protein